MKYGANINNRTEDGWTPLHSAAFWNKLSCVQLLIAAGADLSARKLVISMLLSISPVIHID